MTDQNYLGSKEDITYQILVNIEMYISDQGICPTESQIVENAKKETSDKIFIISEFYDDHINSYMKNVFHNVDLILNTAKDIEDVNKRIELSMACTEYIYTSALALTMEVLNWLYSDPGFSVEDEYESCHFVDFDAYCNKLKELARSYHIPLL